MDKISALYIPVAVPTYHMETADKMFDLSVKMLRSVDEGFICPPDKLLSVEQMLEFAADKRPDILVFQNISFANSAYISRLLALFDCPVLLWTLREPHSKGGRLCLNSLTGAYSAANAMRDLGRNYEYVYGGPDEARVREAVTTFVRAAKIKKAMRSLKIAAVGHTPQGFGFGRALDAELLKGFGAELETIEARELMGKARSYTQEECKEFLDKSLCAMCRLESTPEKNLSDYARLYKAYADYVKARGIGALASRCWPDFFTDYGTPVCGVLSMLNDEGIAAACEADIYGALSMWIGMKLSQSPVFFGDPVALDEKENTISYWHCGAGACSLAREDTGALVGVHPNRKIGPAMDFGCRPFPEATVFRVGRNPDGSFRFFIMEGSVEDKEKQFTGTSLVFKCRRSSREIVEESIRHGLEPHFAVIQGAWGDCLAMLGRMLGMEVMRY